MVYQKLKKYTKETLQCKKKEIFGHLLNTGICIQQIHQQYIINIVLWVQTDDSEMRYLMIGNESKQSYLYKIPFYEISGIQIGCPFLVSNEINSERILGIIWSSKIMWLYFPTATSSRVFRDSFTKMLSFNTKKLKIIDYL